MLCGLTLFTDTKKYVYVFYGGEKQELWKKYGSACRLIV